MLKGIITLRHKRDGRVMSEERLENTITDAGIGQVSGLINGQVTDTFQYLAIGSSSTAIGSGDNTLGVEITGPTGLDREIANTITQATDTITDDTARLKTTYVNTSSSTISVREAGIFDTSTEDSGNMLGGETFAVKNMEANDELQIQYDIVVS